MTKDTGLLERVGDLQPTTAVEPVFKYRVTLLNRHTDEERLLEFTAADGSFALYLDLLNHERVSRGLRRSVWTILDQQCQESDAGEWLEF